MPGCDEHSTEQAIGSNSQPPSISIRISKPDWLIQLLCPCHGTRDHAHVTSCWRTMAPGCQIPAAAPTFFAVTVEQPERRQFSTSQTMQWPCRLPCSGISSNTLVAPGSTAGACLGGLCGSAALALAGASYAPSVQRQRRRTSGLCDPSHEERRLPVAMAFAV